MGQPKRTALIADDEASIRRLFTRLLGQLGYESVAVATGREVLRQMARRDFSLLLLDVMMPEMSRLEVLKRLRVDHPKTCIVMLSALVATDVAAKALKGGADDYITKPCNLDDLSKRLQQAYRRRERARSNGDHPHLQENPPRDVDLEEVTRDLVQQEVTLFQQAMARVSDKAPPSSPRRRLRWPPWNR